MWILTNIAYGDQVVITLLVDGVDPKSIIQFIKKLNYIFTPYIQNNHY
jgi:hypothetical protein